ncbi:MAG: hypothetical protein AAFX87_29545 [Bacteroidota bacterium]
MKILKYLSLCSIVVAVSACSSSQDPTPVQSSSFAMFVTTNTQDGSGFLIPFDSLPSGEIDITQYLANGVQLSDSRFAGTAHNGAVFSPTNSVGDPGVQKFELDASGRFIDAGFIPYGPTSVGSGPIYGFANDTKGYYTNHTDNQKGIQIFDVESMTRTGEIDCSEAMEAIIASMDTEDADRIVATGIGGFMLERDGKIFTQVFFTDENNWEVVDKTFVAVIDVATDRLDKIIEWGDDFVRIGYFSCMNCNYATIGDDNALYLASFIGNFTDPEGPNFRVLRIKSGETEFDSEWNIDGNRGDFANGENFALGSIAHNGKIYVKMFDAPVDITWALLSEKHYYAYEIDIATKSAKKIDDIPVAYWRSIHGPEVFNNKPYFIVENAELDDPNDPNQGKAYYYSYDPATGNSQLEITILNGQPQKIIQF